jgi:hypothetical protein
MASNSRTVIENNFLAIRIHDTTATATSRMSSLCVSFVSLSLSLSLCLLLVFVGGMCPCVSYEGACVCRRLVYMCLSVGLWGECGRERVLFLANLHVYIYVVVRCHLNLQEVYRRKKDCLEPTYYTRHLSSSYGFSTG